MDFISEAAERAETALVATPSQPVSGLAQRLQTGSGELILGSELSNIGMAAKEFVPLTEKSRGSSVAVQIPCLNDAVATAHLHAHQRMYYSYSVTY